MNDIILTNIQRFSLHDGPGIRTTVFIKGCSLHCPWCSNPENIDFSIQSYNKNGVKGTYGKRYDCSKLYKELLKDRPFYGETSDYHVISAPNIDNLPGGVTFSGGECLLQIRNLEPLLIKLKGEHIHIAAETALFVQPSLLQMAIQYIDLFYVDIKILDEERCRVTLGGDLQLYLDNLDKLLKSKIPAIFRVPVIGKYTDDTKNRQMIAELIRKNRILKVELIKEHNLGISKWESLAKCNDSYKIPKYYGVTDGLMEEYKRELEETVQRSIPIEICKI